MIEKDIECLLRCETKLRECEAEYRVTGIVSSWLQLMIDLGFFVDGRFLEIKQILIKCNELDKHERVFALESVCSDLSYIAAYITRREGWV